MKNNLTARFKGEIMEQLIDTKKYWLGATWGTYDKKYHSFKVGNSFVPVSKTVYAKSRENEVYAKTTRKNQPLDKNKVSYLL